MQITLTPEEFAKLMRPVRVPRERQGGFQRLIERLQTGVRQDTRTLTLSAEDARAVLRYAAEDYGAGTYQAQLRAIAPKVRAALGEPAATGSLFGDDL